MPCSSMSLLTWRSRSGLALSVCTPCWVSVERRMYVGMPRSPCPGSRRAYPGRLIEVEHRGSDVEERAQDDIGEEERDAEAVVALGVQEDLEGVLRDPDDEHERGERAECVGVVGPSELAAAYERGPERETLDERRRHGHA